MSLVIENENVIVVLGTEHEKITNELIELVPPSWTNTSAKQQGGVFWALMSGIGLVLATISTIITQAKRQLRVKTASGNYLDIISQDFFGISVDGFLPRIPNEDDDGYRDRILAELLRIRGTVRGVSEAVTMVTDAAPSIFEPFNVVGTGGWGGSFGGAFIPAMRVRLHADNATQAVGAFGDLGVNTAYNFFITIIDNPKGASLETIAAIVKRVKPVGTIAHVSLGTVTVLV